MLKIYLKKKKTGPLTSSLYSSYKRKTLNSSRESDEGREPITQLNLHGSSSHPGWNNRPSSLRPLLLLVCPVLLKWPPHSSHRETMCGFPFLNSSSWIQHKAWTHLHFCASQEVSCLSECSYEKKGMEWVRRKGMSLERFSKDPDRGRKVKEGGEAERERRFKERSGGRVRLLFIFRPLPPPFIFLPVPGCAIETPGSQGGCPGLSSHTHLARGNNGSLHQQSVLFKRPVLKGS